WGPVLNATTRRSRGRGVERAGAGGGSGALPPPLVEFDLPGPPDHGGLGGSAGDRVAARRRRAGEQAVFHNLSSSPPPRTAAGRTARGTPGEKRAGPTPRRGLTCDRATPPRGRPLDRRRSAGARAFRTALGA